MKRILSLVLAVVLMLTSGIIATAEGEKILKVHLLNEVESLEIGLTSAGQSFDVIAATTEGLYNLDAAGAVIPAIATGYTVEETEEGVVYTFTLREDAFWSNGAQVTADDFVYAWVRGIDDVTRPDYTYAWIFETACIKNASKILAHELPATDLGVKAIDDFTLEVTLETACGYFVNLMAFPMFYPINREFAEAKGEDFGKTSDDVLAAVQLPSSAIIIGGGVIGLEFATLFSALGKKLVVTSRLGNNSILYHNNFVRVAYR